MVQEAVWFARGDDDSGSLSTGPISVVPSTAQRGHFDQSFAREVRAPPKTRRLRTLVATLESSRAHSPLLREQPSFVEWCLCRDWGGCGQSSNVRWPEVKLLFVYSLPRDGDNCVPGRQFGNRTFGFSRSGLEQVPRSFRDFFFFCDVERVYSWQLAFLRD